jgi:DNA invertase Pin-like site-specific DNA recombinase
LLRFARWNGLSKLFLTIAAAFAEAERDRIRERIGQAKADQKARGLYLGGTMPFGFRRGAAGELFPGSCPGSSREAEAQTIIAERPRRQCRNLSLGAVSSAPGSGAVRKRSSTP